MNISSHDISIAAKLSRTTGKKAKRKPRCPRVIIEISGGVGEITLNQSGHGKAEVEIVDWDNIKESEDGSLKNQYAPWVIKKMQDYPGRGTEDFNRAIGKV